MRMGYDPSRRRFQPETVYDLGQSKSGRSRAERNQTKGLRTTDLCSCRIFFLGRQFGIHEPVVWECDRDGRGSPKLHAGLDVRGRDAGGDLV